MVRYNNQVYVLFALENDKISSTPRTPSLNSALSFFKCTAAAAAFLEADAKREDEEKARATNRETQTDPLLDDADAKDERKQSETKPAINRDAHAVRDPEDLAMRLWAMHEENKRLKKLNASLSR